ncbi:MAG: hypothetical protein RL156_1673 [Bacteroidota bacterium]
MSMLYRFSFFSALLVLGVLVYQETSAQPFARPFGVTMPMSKRLASENLLPREVHALDSQDVLSTGDGHFVNAKGQRVRLFGTLLSYATCYPDSATAIRVAERFRALGISAIRMRGWEYSSYLIPASATVTDTILNATYLKRFDWFIYQLAKNGIYVFLTNAAFMPKRNDGVAQYDSINYPWQVRVFPYVDKAYQQAQRKFLRRFLTHVNPYTGRALKDEPALALMSTTDENQLLGYWNNNFRENSTNLLPTTQRRRLDSSFNAYLKAKYGNDQALQAAWSNGPVSAVNQFKDPGFEDLFTSPWQANINTNNGAQAAYISSDADKVEGTRSAVFKILKGGMYSSDVQLVLTGLKCEKGKQYKFSMWMRSPEAGRKVNVYLLRGSTPYTNYGLSTSFSLNTAWTEHSMSFASTATDDNALLIIQLGQYNSDVYFDKGSLTEDSVAVLRPGESLAASNVSLMIAGQVVSVKRILETTDFLNALQESYYTSMRTFIRDTLKSHMLVGGSTQTASLIDAYSTRTMDFTSANNYRGTYSIAPNNSKPNPWDSLWSLRRNLNAEDINGNTVASLARAKVRGVPLVLCSYFHAYPSPNVNEMMSFVPLYAAYQDADAYFFGDWIGTNTAQDFDSSWISKTCIWESKAQYAMQALMLSVSAAWHKALVAPATDVIRINYNSTQRKNLRYQVSGHFLLDACDQRMGFFRRVEIDSFDATSQTVLPHLVIPEYNNTGGLDYSNIQSDTKQLTWNQQAGWMRVSTPRFISATGKLKNSVQTFDNITVEKTDTTTYGTFMWISADTNSITESENSLITVAGHVANYGAKLDGDTTLWRGWGKGGVQADGMIMRCSMRSTFDSLLITPLDSLGGIVGAPFPAAKSSTGRFSFELDQAKTGSQWFKVQQKRVLNSVADQSPVQTLEVYPNPASDVAVFAWSGNSVPAGALVCVRDMLGRIVLQTPLQGEHSVAMPLGHLTAGTYVAELVSGTAITARAVFVHQ